MSEATRSPLLTIAKIAAVVLALGATAYAVHRAQSNANPDENTKPAAADTQADDKPSKEDEAIFLRSSKSLSIDEAFEAPEVKDPPEFLPSSKSSIGIVPRGSKDSPKTPTDDE